MVKVLLMLIFIAYSLDHFHRQNEYRSVETRGVDTSETYYEGKR
jgi:hypothetical protein